jgi:hypothetical protein
MGLHERLSRPPSLAFDKHSVSMVCRRTCERRLQAMKRMLAAVICKSAAQAHHPCRPTKTADVGRAAFCARMNLEAILKPRPTRGAL